MASSSPVMAEPDQVDSRPTQRRKVKRQLNVRLLLGTLIAAVVLGPSAYFFREFQVKRTAGDFLTRADTLEGEGKPGEAADYLFRYLHLRPDDASVRVRLAKTFGEAAADDPRLKQRAINLYYRALGVASEDERLSLRSSLTDLLLETGQLAKAEAEAKELLREDPDDAQGLRALALAHLGRYVQNGRITKSEDGISIGEEIERALERDQGNITLARTLAQTYRTEPLLLREEEQELDEALRAKLADDVMDRMVELNVEDADAYLARYLYRNEYELDGAKEDLEIALTKTPDNVGVLLLAAEHDRQEALRVLREEGLADDAQKAAEVYLTTASKHYNHILDDINPKDERAHMGLGDILLRLGKADEAIKAWQKGLAVGNANSILLNLRLAGLFLAQGSIEPAEDAVNALSAGVEERIATLPRPARLSLERQINMLKGRCFAAKGEYPKAIAELKRVLASGTSSEAQVSEAYQAEMLLGRVHSSLDEWKLAAAAFERAAMLQPKLAQARIEAFAARATTAAMLQPELAHLDQTMAIRHYDMVVAQSARAKGQPITNTQRSEAWYNLAVVRFQRESRLPNDRRNWAPFETAMSVLVPTDGQISLANPWRLDLLRANYKVAIGKEEGNREKGLHDAVELLRTAEVQKQYEMSAEFLQNLVLGYERLEAPENADRVMEKLEALTGKSVTTCVLRSRLHSSRKQYDKAREILNDGLRTLPPSDHATLRQNLARVNIVEGQRQRLELYSQDQTNVEQISHFIDSAFEQGNLLEVQHWEQTLRSLEGADSPHADYAKVLRLLADATDPKDAKFIEGVKLLSDIERQLPDSPQIQMLQGLVLQGQGERQKAIEAYQKAILLGMHTASAYERLVAALGDEGRFDEARTYFANAEERNISSDRLKTLEIAVAARDAQLDQAEEIARVAAAENPESASAKLNHAQMLVANKKPEEAESAYQEAIQRAPTDLRTYAALFNFYLQTEHKDLAKQTLQELEDNVELTPATLAPVLAESYERLGDTEKAEAHYRKAQELESEDTAGQMRLADFLTRHDRADEAEAILRNILQEDPEANAARYRLASILVARGGQEEWQAALKLLEQSRTDENVSPLDRRLQASLLIKRAGRENLAKARRLLEGLVLDTEAPADADRLSLARVYEAEIARLQGEGNAEGAKKLFQDARKQYTEVVGNAKPDPSHLALFVEFLIRSDEAGSASEYLERLEELTPDNLGTMRLRARWLNAENRTEEIKPLVEARAEKLLTKIVDDPKTEARLASTIGGIYFDVALYPEAERWFRRLIELDPTVYAPLVTVLARQDRIKDVIDVCTEAAKSDKSARPAALLASLLVMGNASEEESQQAEALLKIAVEDYPDDVTLLLGMANLRVSQKEMDEAANLYRLVLEHRKGHLIALNNLATLLSESPGKSEEALKTIDQAIDIAGEQAAFLDTKGMILVHSGKPEQALEFLEQAASSTGSDPRYHFHLAVAHIRNGNLDKASASLQEANRSDLESQFLTEMDLQLLAELEEKLQK